MLLALATLGILEPSGESLVRAARKQVGVTVSYDPAYRKISYPGGDVPKSTGVCTDVVIRALRAQGIDLQRLVHEDMKRSFSSYPKNWGLRKPDPNIDHRRVPNLETFFRRRGKQIRTQTYLAGDIVTWMLPNGRDHIGIITKAPNVVHNIGRGAREEPILHSYRITGLYRYYR